MVFWHSPVLRVVVATGLVVGGAWIVVDVLSRPLGTVGTTAFVVVGLVQAALGPLIARERIIIEGDRLTGVGLWRTRSVERGDVVAVTTSDWNRSFGITLELSDGHLYRLPWGAQGGRKAMERLLHHIERWQSEADSA
jgi:hypothetical protein